MVLDPSDSTPPGCADDTLTEGNSRHSLTLTNVAILAPEGAVYARRWHLPHAAAGGPILTIEGSVAAKHLGLYGIPDPATGDMTNGWSKHFTYPTDFWRARPPWWPDFTGNEWASSDAVPTTTPTTTTTTAPTTPPARPTGLMVNPTPGSRVVDVDWDDVDGADAYLVRWRRAGAGHDLNIGVRPTSSDTQITVFGSGRWVVRVEACNAIGCSAGTASQVEVAAS